MASAQGLLHSVFSCSSPASRSLNKRRLRQTRSLDPAIIRSSDTEGDLSCGEVERTPGEPVASRSESQTRSRSHQASLSSVSTPPTPLDVSPSSTSSFQFDYDLKSVKRNTVWDLPFLTPSSSSVTIFSPRKWLQKKSQHPASQDNVVWRSQVKQFVCARLQR